MPSHLGESEYREMFTWWAKAKIYVIDLNLDVQLHMSTPYGKQSAMFNGPEGDICYETNR